MGERTKIEWCDHTFNPWLGCTRVSEGCDHCYAERLAKRLGVGWGPHAERRLISENSWAAPFRWAARARSKHIRRRVFCASMADVFDNQVPREWRGRLWGVIRDTPELDWLILTKRPENVTKMLPVDWGERGWENVWLGFSAENQQAWDQRWPIMRDIPAVVRFCSYEPALGPLFILGTQSYKLNWLICGGESGPGHRPMLPEWELSIREQCAVAEIAYFFKQLEGKAPIPASFPVRREFPAARSQYELF
jgi:protein gp37